MDVRYINPFLAAVKEVFETMIEIPFTVGKPSLKKDGMPTHDVSSIIGISGNVTGCVVITLSEKTALQLASALIGDEIPEMDEDCIDAIGEIANMVAGSAKNGFPVANTSLSVPTVVLGKHQVNYPSAIPIISIPCETTEGMFGVDIALKEVSSSNP
ncbi:MAG: chemotaxis protein CheX [Desulfatiglandaceae bacterium]